MTVTHEQAASQFQVKLPEGTAVLEYREMGDTLDMFHTHVPPTARGEGVGEALAKHALDWARENGKQVVASCPFVKKYVGEHAEYADLVGSGG